MRRNNSSSNKNIVKNIKFNEEEKMNAGINIINKYKSKIAELRKERIEKPKEDKKKISFKYVLITIIVILVFASVSILLEYAPILGLKILPNTNAIKYNIDIFSDEKNIYKNYDNELLVFSNSLIQTYNKDSKKTWEYKIENSNNPSIYTADKFMVISNNSIGSFSLFSGKNELSKGKIDGIIDDIYLDNFGNFAIEYSATGYKKVIAIYDKYSTLKYNIYISSAAILEIKLIDNAKKVLLFQTDSSSLTIGTKISLIDLEKNLKIEELANIENKLIYSSKNFFEKIIYVTNNALEEYTYKDNKTNKIHNLNENQTNFIAISNDYFVAIESIDNKFKFLSNSFDNKNISSLELDNLPKYIYNSGLLTYIISENSVDVVNKWGTLVKKIEIAIPPKEVIVFNKEKSLAMIYSNRIEIINL